MNEEHAAPLEVNSSMNLPLPAPFALAKSSYAFLGKHWKHLFLILAPVMLIELALAVLAPYVASLTHTAGVGTGLFVAFILVNIILRLASFVLGIMSTTAAIWYVIEAQKGNDPSIKASYGKALSLFGPILWVSLLTMLVNAATFSILILPIFAAIVYLSFSTFIVIDGKRRGLSALAASARMVQGQWWKIFGRMLFMVLSLIPLGVAVFAVFSAVTYLCSLSIGVPFSALSKQSYSLGSIVFGTLTSLFAYPYASSVYHAALVNRQDSLTDEKVEKTRKIFLGFSIWGAIVIALIAIGFVLLGFLALALSTRESMSHRSSIQIDTQSINQNYKPGPVDGSSFRAE